MGVGVDVLTSLAGRVREPALPVGRVRIGGFGGPDGLAAFLTEQRIAAVVDATHPFAARIGSNVAVAAARTGTPLLRLERPGWADHPLAPSWTWVPDVEGALAAADHATHPFLTTGRQWLESFLPWSDRAATVRLVDPPAFPLPAIWTLIISRGPYRFEDELQLMIEFRVDALITKDSGGAHTVAKLEAAGELGSPVVIIQRPERPTGATAISVGEAVDWCVTLLHQGTT
jgi:precorrin-6A/cobalt-precorrin-6A reductase